MLVATLAVPCAFVLGLMLVTTSGARHRGTGIRRAAVAGLCFPITWAVSSFATLCLTPPIQGMGFPFVGAGHGISTDSRFALRRTSWSSTALDDGRFEANCAMAAPNAGV